MLSTQAHLLLNNNQACLAQQVHRTLRHQLPFLERLLAYFKAQFLQMHLKVNSLLNCLAKRTLEPLTCPKQKVLLLQGCLNQVEKIKYLLEMPNSKFSQAYLLLKMLRILHPKLKNLLYSVVINLRPLQPNLLNLKLTPLKLNQEMHLRVFFLL